MERVLVIRGGALGDFILGLPALKALRGAFPKAYLELIAPAAVLSLARNIVDAATPLERAEIAFLFQEGALPDEIADLYGNLDLVVLWLADGSGAVRRNFERLGARRILWAPALPQQPGRHAADHLLDTLRPLGIIVHDRSGFDKRRSCLQDMAEGLSLRVPRDATWFESHEATRNLKVAATLYRRASRPRSQEGTLGAYQDYCTEGLDLPPGSSIIAIHPGSGGAWKCWSAERFAVVADHLLALGHRVLLIQGPADVAAVERVRSIVQMLPLPVVAGLNVEGLAALLSSCSGYLGNDSGVTHLAAAVGTPTVAIFGPTDPAVWAPLGPRVIVLKSPIECSPCTRERAMACRVRACLEGVQVEQVLPALEDLLK